MAPLILHNVPDEELYVGDDGIKRPYALVFPHQDGLPGSVRARRGVVAETGSFGKSTRRSRSRTGTPARRENPTLAAADKIFGSWISQNATATTSTSNNPPSNSNAPVPQRKTSGHNLLSQQQQQQDEAAPAVSNQRVPKSEPTEVILRGYRSSLHQYAAVNHFEQLAGPICEDYPREPPPDQRRYKGDLRDPGFTRPRVLTQEARNMVNNADGGEHWVKVTFESSESAEAAIFASPQNVQGFLVSAERYRGFAPAQDEAIPAVQAPSGSLERIPRSQSAPFPAFSSPRRRNGEPPRSTDAFQAHRSMSDLSPEGSHASSQTLDTATLSQSQTASSGTMAETAPFPDFPSTNIAGTDTPAGTDATHEQQSPEGDSVFCRRIPTARRMTLRPAEEAHLPSQSFTAKLLAAVPILMWFVGGFGAMIGNEVPRKEDGEFDYDRANLYWKFIWWLDATFRLFGGEIMNAADKED